MQVRKSCSCHHSKTSINFANINVTKTDANGFSKNNEKLHSVDNKEYISIDDFVNNMIQDHIEREKSRNKAEESTRNSYMPKKANKHEGLKFTKSYKKARNDVNTLTVNYSQNKMNSAAATLSAQIMNLPYNEFKDNISTQYENVSIDEPKTSKYDIFTRIKEAYQACSCKICECIIGKSTFNNDVCNCKPCECNDCLTYASKGSNTKYDESWKLSRNFALTNSKRKEPKPYLRQAFSNSQTCDCKPCDCMDCTNEFAEPCDCKPCQCIECKSMASHKIRTIVVAPVGEDNQRNLCQCSPCDCLHCVHNYGMSSNATHEVSTGMTGILNNCRCDTCFNEACRREGMETCRCEKHVVQKPVQRDTQDYDIRRASIVEPRKNYQRTRTGTKHNTIAMLASLPTNYPRYISKKSFCSCDECECIICKERGQDYITAAPVDPKLYFDNKTSKTSNFCNCSPCECQFCKKQNKNYQDNSAFFKIRGICKCGTCDCIKCGTSETTCNKYNTYNKKYLINTNNLKENCKCSTCECMNCEKVLNKCSGDKCECDFCRCKTCYNKSMYDPSEENTVTLPQSKGKPNLLDSSFCTKNLITSDFAKAMVKDNSTNTGNRRTEQNFAVYHAFDFINKIQRVWENPPTNLLRHVTDDNIRYSETLKSDKDLNSKENIKTDNERQTNEEDIIQNQDSEDYVSCVSTPSSTSTISQIIHTEDTLGKEINYHGEIPDRSLISWDSCTSYKSSDYAIKFPRSLAKTVLCDDSMKCLQLSVNCNNLVDLSSQTLPYNNYSKIKTRTIKESEETQTPESSNPNYFSRYLEANGFLSVVSSMKKLGNFQSNKMKLDTTVYHKTEIDVESHRNCINIIENLLNKDAMIDYTRTQETLKEAREFSAELTTILAKYEKANREFRSISQKLDQNPKVNSSLSSNKNCDNVTNFQVSILNKQSIFDDRKIPNDNNSNINEHENKELEVESQVCYKSESYIKSVNNKKSCDQAEFFEFKMLNKNEFSTYTKFTKDTVAVSKKTNISNYTKNDINTTRLQGCRTTNATVSEVVNFENMTTNDEKNTDIKKIETSIPKIKDLQDNHSINDDFNKITEHWPIVKKNFNLNMNKIATTLSLFPKSLDLELKDNKKSLSTEITEDNYKHENKYLQTCASMKVCFQDLRRISDHTVLVKWNVPKDVSKIQGYELLVDGRPVQKVLNANRSMAVITCLPHTQRVLLTVRTITPIDSEFGHSPATTVIYHPRRK